MHRITLLALGVAAGCAPALDSDNFAGAPDATEAADIAEHVELTEPEPEVAPAAVTPAPEPARPLNVLIPESEWLAVRLRAALSSWVDACGVAPEALTVAAVDPERANVRLAPVEAVTEACAGDPAVAESWGCTASPIGVRGPAVAWMLFAERLTAVPESSPTVHTVFMHEVGHALGAHGHLQDELAVMFANDAGADEPTPVDCEFLLSQGGS